MQLNTDHDAPCLLRNVKRLIRKRLEAQQPLVLSSIARELALSTRSLQRKLKEHDASFSALLREERLHAITQLSPNIQRSDDLARALGYASSRSVDRVRAQQRKSTSVSQR